MWPAENNELLDGRPAENNDEYSEAITLDNDQTRALRGAMGGHPPWVLFKAVLTSLDASGKIEDNDALGLWIDESAQPGATQALGQESDTFAVLLKAATDIGLFQSDDMQCET